MSKEPTAPVTIPLAEPVTQGGETIAEIVLQPLLGRYYRTMPTELGMNELLNLAGKLSGQPDTTLDKLDPEDAAAVMKAVQDAIAAIVNPQRALEIQRKVQAGEELEKPKAPITIPLAAPVRIHEPDGSKREVAEITMGKLTARALRVVPPGSNLGPPDLLRLAEVLIREGTQGLSTTMVRDLVDALNPTDLVEVVQLAEDFILYVQVGMNRP